MNEPRRYGFHSLRFKLALASVVVEAIMLTALIWNSTRITGNALNEISKNHVESLVPLLNAGIAAPLAQRDYATLDELLGRIVRRESLVYVEVRDELGNLAAKRGKVPETTQFSASFETADGVFDQALDITVANRIIGRARYGLNISLLEATVVSLRRQGAVVAFAEIVITFLLLSVLGFLLTRHLKALAQAARAVEGGDYTVRLTVAGRDEVADTANAFNAMAQTIARDITERKRAADLSRRNEERFQLASQASNDVIWDWDLLHSTIWWNQNFTQLFGYPSHEIEPGIESWINRLHPDDRDRVVTGIRAVIDHGGRSWKDEYRFRRRDGSYAYIFDRGYVIRDDQDKPMRMVGAMLDITERMQAAEQTRKLSSAIEQTADSVVITDRAGVIEYVNPAFEAITGFPATEALGRKPNILKSGEHDDAFYRDLWNTILHGEVFRAAFVNRRKDGVLYHEEKTITPLRDAAGTITHFVSTGKDITERVRAEGQLSYLAHHDALTGLPNRTLFNDRLEQAMIEAERHERLLAVVFLDLDRFKDVNDTLGHEAGDLLLKGVAERLLGAVRRGDTVARLSGDEFTLVLADMSHVDDAARVARKILDVFAQPFHIAGRDLFVSASLGLTLFPFDTRAAQELLRYADVAMYRAKEAGRNSYQFYTAEMTTKAVERIGMENDLRLALKRGEFVLHYQPIVSCSDGRIIGVEALVRWQSPDHGLVPPLRFIPLAEETGLIEPLGEWVLHTACAQLGRWKSAGFPELRMAVNISVRQFRRGGLAQVIAQALTAAGIAPRQLELEITESVLAQGKEAEELLREVSATGVQFSIDDFGTGYSSLSYLKRFPIDTLKIDQSFVRDIPGDANDSAIAMAIIVMAHSLDIGVIAVGVETAEQRLFMKRHGCNAMQGYFFSRPLPAEELTLLLENGSLLPVKQ